MRGRQARVSGRRRRARALLASTALGSLTLGSTALGSTALGSTALGSTALGAPAASTGRGATGATGAPRISYATATISVVKGDAAPPFDVARRLRVPQGWKVQVWARVSGARFEAFSPQGDLLVSLPTAGKVVELVPARDASAAPGLRVVLSGLRSPQGLAFDDRDGHEVLYVGEADRIDRYTWSSKGPGKRGTLIGGLPWTAPKGSDDHPLKSVAVAADHTVYFDIGSSANVDTADLATFPPRASVISIAPDGTDMKVLAIGARNAEGLAVAPDGKLWAAVNERDNVPYPFHRGYGGYDDAFGKVIRSYVNDNPPDELARVAAQRNLGWPFCDPTAQRRPGVAGSAVRFTDLSFVPDAVFDPGGRVLDCAKLPPVELGLPAHSAPLGLSFLESSRVATPWREGALLALHGSWDRRPPQPPALLWLPWSSRTGLLGTPITVLSGFQLSDGHRWGRPVDAVAGPDGALYVSDNQAGAIYRVLP